VATKIESELSRDDLRRCRAIRSALDRPLRFVLDANQAFTDPAEAVAVLRQIIDVLGDVAGIEQPCPKGRHQDMKFVMRRLPGVTIFADESCGQCTPCRVGTVKAAHLMVDARWDRALLEELSQTMADASICGLGQAAPNPIRCVIKYFPHEIA